MAKKGDWLQVYDPDEKKTYKGKVVKANDKFTTIETLDCVIVSYPSKMFKSFNIKLENGQQN